jgi:iron complex outermembrane recepter protein
MSRQSCIASAIRPVLSCAALTAAFTAMVAHAQEQTQTTTGEQTLQTVVVTGSMIKRSDFETPSPVQVISSQDLQQSGYTSVQQVLSNLAANGQGTLSQGFSGAFAAGASGIALRGLTVGATLTLIDGQRMVAYPLTDDGQRSFVDTASIPLVAVDRIDVLKDGASAEYGSDAMAGVVNVILKKSYVGAELSADAGTTIHGDGSTERLSGMFGRGDLASDGYNAYLAVEWRHQDEIWNYNRTGQPWNELNWTPMGGTNSTPGAGSLYADYGFGTSFPAASGYYLVPASATSFQSPGVVFPTSACPSAAALAADQCTFTEKGFQIQPQTGNLNIIGRLTTNLGGTWQAIVTGSMFHSEAEQSGAYPLMAPNGPGNPIQFPAYGPGFLTVTNPITLTVPCGNPMNPAGKNCTPLYPVGNLYEFGSGEDEIATTTDRVFVDFKGTELGWDLDGNFGWMYARTDQTLLGLVSYQGLQNALDNGYVFGTGGPGAAGISVPINNEMSNSLQVIDLRGTRDVLTLPGGPMSLGLGLGFNHRYLDAVTSPLAQGGDYQIVNNTYAYGGQTDYSAYGEIVAPIIKGLEVDIAQRYDHYNNVGGASVPKFGVKYTPIREITLRGTYGKGFRAPNPAEYSHAASAFLLGEYADSLLCPSSNTPANQYIPAYNLNYPVTPTAGDVAAFCNFPATFVQGTNPALQPERSTNYTYGAIFQPVDQLSLSVDFWDIKVTNLIVSPSEFPALPFPPQPVQNARTGPATLPVLQANGSTVLQTFPEGEPIYSLVSYENAGEIHVNGVDVDLDSHFDIGRFGRLSASLNWSHEFLWDMSSCYAGQCATVYLAGTHGPTGISGDTGNPKDRAVLTLSWDKGPWDMTWTINYTGHYSLIDPSTDITTCSEAIQASFNGAAKFANGATPYQYCTVSHFTDVNLYISYAVNSHLSFTGSVVNLFNTPPPVDLQTYGNSILSYNPSLAQDGAIGTFFNLGVKYKF